MRHFAPTPGKIGCLLSDLSRGVVFLPIGRRRRTEGADNLKILLVEPDEDCRGIAAVDDLRILLVKPDEYRGRIASVDDLRVLLIEEDEIAKP